MTRDEYLALLRGSIFYMMKKSGVALKHIDMLVVGLPVSNWRPMQAELSRIAKGPHQVPVPVALRSNFGERVEVTIGRVLVLPQPMGALHNATLGREGNPLQDETSVHMVIDPGYNTFDWFLSVGIRPDLQRSGSLQGGVSQLLRLVANAAGGKIGVGTLNLNEVEKGLSEGVMHAYGKRLDMIEFRPIIEAAAAQVVDRFVNSIDMSLGVNNIYLVGGGASF